MEIYVEQLQRLKQLNPHLVSLPMDRLSPATEEVELLHQASRIEKSEFLKHFKKDLRRLEIAIKAYEDTPNAHPGLALDQTLSHLMSLKEQHSNSNRINGRLRELNEG